MQRCGRLYKLHDEIRCCRRRRNWREITRSHQLQLYLQRGAVVRRTALFAEQLASCELIRPAHFVYTCNRSRCAPLATVRATNRLTHTILSPSGPLVNLEHSSIYLSGTCNLFASLASRLASKRAAECKKDKLKSQLKVEMKYEEEERGWPTLERVV